MRLPLSTMSPLVGPKRPLIRLNSVDLPAPFGPMIATRSPGVTARFGAADDLGLAEGLAQVLQLDRIGDRHRPSLRAFSASISPWTCPQTRAKRRRVKSNIA